MDENNGLLDQIREQFNIAQYNLLQDEEHYYLFRALNNRDHKDLEDGLTVEDGKITRIRTDLASYDERRSMYGEAIYKEDDPISLVQVIDHIKRGHRTDTNCISLSSNANVSILYGQGYYHDEYVMIKIPKETVQEKTYNASEYMLSEMEQRISKAIQETDREEVKNLMARIDSASNMDELMEAVSDSYKCPQAENEDVRYTCASGEAARRTTIRSRFSRFPTLSDSQNLIKNKIVAKLTILEEKGLMEPIMKNNRLDTTAIRTLGMAISSSELLHYGEIRAIGDNGNQQIFEVQKELMHMIGILQQVAENRPELTNTVSKIEHELIKEIVAGRELAMNVEQLDEANPTKLSIKQAYELCGGKLQYDDAKETLDKIFYLSNSILKARQYGSLINELTGNKSEYGYVIEAISQIGLDIEPALMDRKGVSKFKLCESVSIPLMKHEDGLVQMMQGLQTSELKVNQDLGKSVIASLPKVQEESVIPIDEYYARAIYSSYNWEEQHIRFTKAHEERFIKRLKERKISTIYETLKGSKIDENALPGIIMNLIMSDKEENIKNVEALEQGKVTSQFFEEINELQGEISADQIEDYLDFFKVEGTDIRLREYQQSAINNVDKIFEKHRFASVVLPTGAGKSFVAIAELRKMEKMAELAKIQSQGEATGGKILYLAPSVEILDQIMKYTEIYVHGEKLNKTRAQIFKEVFPNVELATYQSLLSKSDEELKSSKYSFIVLDELHRTGAEKWGEKLRILLEAQDESTKVLGITATPERDMDNRNMADEIAETMGFTRAEIKARQHIAKKMDIVDAIRMGIVVAPKIVECDYSMKNDTEKWNSLLEEINSLEDGSKKEELERKYSELRAKVDDAKGIPDVFRDNIVKKDGKYIFYMPIGSREYAEDEEGNIIGKKTGAEKVKKAEEQLREWLKYVDDEPEFYSMLGEYGDKKNTKQLNDFEDSKSEHIKIMIAMNKLNEGVHVRGINGIIWHRSLDENSRILLLQQLGRAIYSTKEGEKISEEDRPVVIDLPNNMSRVDLNKIINTYTEEEDIAILQNILDWIHENDEILPDINSGFKEEARLARELKRIQRRYNKYSRLDERESGDYEDFDSVEEILNMGSEIDLWDIELPDREIKEKERGSNKSVDGQSMEEFFVKGLAKELEDFVQVVKKSKMTVFEEVMKWAREHGRIPRALHDAITSEEKIEKNLYTYKWVVSNEKKIVDRYVGKRLEEIPEEYRELVGQIRALGYGLGTGLTSFEEVMKWAKEHGRMPNMSLKGKTKEQIKEERNLYQKWWSCEEKKIVDRYKGKSLEEIPEEHRELVEQLRALGYGLGSGLTPFEEAMKWAKEHGRMPRRIHKAKLTQEEKEEESLYGKWNRSHEKDIVDSYKGKRLEEIPEEHRELVEQVRALGYGQISELIVFDEIMDWAREHGRMPKSINHATNPEEIEERRLYGQWLQTDERRIVDGYVGKSLEKIPEEHRELVKVVREFGYGLTIFDKIMKWANEHGRMPKSIDEAKTTEKDDANNLQKRELTPEEKEENSIYGKWKRSDEKGIVDYYKEKSLEEIPEEYRELVKQVRNLGYGIPTFEEIMKWANEHGGMPRRIHKAKLTQEEKEEAALYIKWLKTDERRIVDSYVGKGIEEIPEKHRALVRQVRALGYGLGTGLTPFEEIMKWAREHGRMPKSINKTTTLEKDDKGNLKKQELTPDEKVESRLYVKWMNTDERGIVDSYVGKMLEEIPEQYRELVKEIRDLGYGLTIFDELMKWVKEHGRMPKGLNNWTTPEENKERNLYSRWMKSKERHIVDSYKGKGLEEIPEEHRELVKQVRALGYDGSRAKKIRTEDIAKNTYDALAPKCEEASNVIEGLIQEKNDPSKKID